ncbi:MAG TPA: hypothetical protein VGY57_06300, partial [Vicinamibacterales bacterium]|nr:hypothetical protein [Vicinamibacterales bacterium]
DFLGVIPAGRTIERRWASAAEHAADSCAAGMNPAARCALASALVKLVKLMPPLAPALAEPISTLVGGGDVTARVARLLDDRPSSVAARASGWRWTAAGVTTLAIAVSYSSWLVIVHEITETLVSSLP